jgi:hypothetical protein
MLGEIVGVGTRQSKSKKGVLCWGNSYFLHTMPIAFPLKYGILYVELIWKSIPAYK